MMAAIIIKKDYILNDIKKQNEEDYWRFKKEINGYNLR